MERLVAPAVINAEGTKKQEPGEIKPLRYNLVVMDYHGTMTDHQLRLLKALNKATIEACGKEMIDAYFASTIQLGSSVLEPGIEGPVITEQIKALNAKKAFLQEALTRPSKESGRGVSNNVWLQQKFEGSFEQPTIDRVIERLHFYLNSTYMPVPGMNMVIRQLLAEGIDIAVLTNGTNREVIQEKLQQWNLPELSDNLYSSHITGHRKPHRDAVNYILNDFRSRGRKVDTSGTLIVGDYLDDIRAAENTGIDSVLVVRGNGWEKFKVKEPKPNYIISDPNDLAKIVHGKFEQEVTDEMEITPALWKNEKWGPRNT